MHWQYPRCSRRRLCVSLTCNRTERVSTPTWRAYLVSLDDYLRAFVALHTFFRLYDDLYPSAQRLCDRHICSSRFWKIFFMRLALYSLALWQ